MRLPTLSSRRRAPTVASAPAATTMRYDRLPRLTSTFMWSLRRLARAARRPITRLSGFQAGETGVGDALLSARVPHGEEGEQLTIVNASASRTAAATPGPGPFSGRRE